MHWIHILPIHIAKKIQHLVRASTTYFCGEDMFTTWVYTNIYRTFEYQHSSPNQNLYSRYSMDCKERSEFWFMRKTSGFPVFTMEVIHQKLDDELILQTLSLQTGPQHMINSVRKVSSNCWESRTKQVLKIQHHSDVKRVPRKSLEASIPCVRWRGWSGGQSTAQNLSVGTHK